MAEKSTFHCSLVTPEAAIFEEDVVYVELPGHDGQIGFEHDRAPILLKMGVGKLRLELSDGTSRRYLLDEGFAQMQDNTLTLISEKAIASSEIQPDDAKAALAAAEALKGVSEGEFEKRQHDIAMAKTMLELAGEMST